MIEVFVSIIIPVYNPPMDLFEECMKSIKKQSFQSFEIILVDDGSEKKVSKYIDELSFKDKSIKVIHQQNLGVSSARNKGLTYATGKYVAFVDADDCLAKDWLQVTVKFAEKEDADIVFGKICKCGKAYEELNNLENQNTLSMIYDKETIWKVQRFLLLNDAISPLPSMKYLDLGSCGKLYKKSAIEHIQFPEAICLCEDQVFIHRVLRSAKKCVICDNAIYFYVNNKESASHRINPNAINIMINALENIENVLFSNKEIQNAFWYSVILNFLVILPLQISPSYKAYRNRDTRKKALIEEMNKPLIKNAIENIDINMIPSKKAAVKVILVKYKKIELFFKLQSIYKKLKIK
jgi:hypothetical protein